MQAVVVIGAGPVGQTAALLLARWDVPVLVLDQRPRRELVGSKAICQHRDVLDVWEAVGAGRRIAAEGVTWSTARTFYRGAELFSLQLGDTGRSPFPPFVNISQSRTEEILDERIAAEPRVEVRWDCQVTGLVQDADAVEVRCADGTTVHAPFAVACTGVGGGLRGMLGVGFEGRSFSDRFLICDIRADLGDWEHERRFYFDPEWNPGRQVLIHPCPGSTYRIDWQVPPEFDLEAEEASGALDARIHQIVGDRPYEVVWRSVYRFHSRHADRLRVGRVLLAGDCAHCFAPFGARGLNSGVQDAENAAWKIAFVLHGWAPPALLESYHDERLAAALENLAVTSATMRFLVPQTADEWARRRSILDRAVTDPDARSLVNSGRLAEPFVYADSPLTTPGHPLAGTLVPDLPLGGAERLRALVRDGLLAVVTGDPDPQSVASALKRATNAPTRVLRLDAIDPDGRTGEVWLIRPDGHVAAVVPASDASALTAAARRAVGHPT